MEEELDSFSLDGTEPDMTEIELPEPEPPSALDQMSEYMGEHDYGREDFETYSKDPEWQALNNELQLEDGLEPTEYDAPEEPSALDQMAEYMSEHDYGREDFETYSKDPEWQALNNQLQLEDGLEPTEYDAPEEPSALDQMAEYMSEHDYGREDFDTYSKDPEWQALNNELQAEDGLEPTGYDAPAPAPEPELSPEPEAEQLPETEPEAEQPVELEPEQPPEMEPEAERPIEAEVLPEEEPPLESPEPQTPMDAYMEAHGYDPEDFEVYSQDPEWQRLNEELQEDIPTTDLTELDETPEESASETEIPTLEEPPAEEPAPGSPETVRPTEEMAPETEEIPEETFPDTEETPEGEVFSDAEETPDGEVFSDTEEIPEEEAFSGTEEIPEGESLPEDAEPVSEEPPLEEDADQSEEETLEGDAASDEEETLEEDIVPEEETLEEDTGSGEEIVEEEPPVEEEESPEREYNEFEGYVLEQYPEFEESYETGAFYEQGINSFGFEGTCGETSQANTVNAVLGTNEWTEDKVLGVAVDNSLCEMYGEPEENGGTTTEQFMELYGKINEQTGGKLDIQLEDFENAPSVEEMAGRLEDGAKLNVAVDSRELWGETRDYVDPVTGEWSDDFYSDHWITVTGVERGPDGEISGFQVIDSGGGVSYLEKDRFERCVFGTEEHRVLDPTCITVRKKD